MSFLEVLAFLIAGACAALLALGNWRSAFLLVVIVGFVQDPLRKITPGEPVMLVVLCTGVMLLALLGAMFRHGFITLRPLTLGNKAARAALTAFVVVVVVQAALSFIRFGSPIVSMVGLLSYLSPVAAVWLAWYYVRSERDVRKFLGLYVALALVAVLGVFLSKIGVESRLLEEVGTGFKIYDRQFGRLDLHAGLMRSPEIAAWHAGAAACFLIVLAVSFRSFILRAVSPFVVLACLTAGILTGRRKILVVVLGFAVVYFMLMYYFRQRTARRALFVVGFATLALVAGALTLTPEDRAYRPYVRRGQSVFSDAEARFTTLGLASVSWAYDRGGFFGLGAGVGSQGSQHFTGGTVIAGGAAEGGLGKIAVELGIPGLVIALFSAILVGRNVKRSLGATSLVDSKVTRLLAGCLAFVAANVPVFIGASQVYGDPFVLIMLGTLLGFVLAGPRILQLAEARRAQAATNTARNPRPEGVPITAYTRGNTA